MPGSNGYSLDQLLEWCMEDRLIDGFRKETEAILLWQNGTQHTLSHADAKVYLASIFTGVKLRSDDPRPDKRNTA